MQHGSMIKVLLVLIALIFLTFLIATPQGTDIKNVSASEFISSVERGDIKDVTIDGDHITGTGPSVGTAAPTEYVTYSSDKSELIRVMHEKHIVYREKQPSSLGPVFWVMLGLLGLLVIGSMLMKKASGANRSMVKRTISNKATLHHTVNVSFKDVAGIDEAVEEVRDLVTFLKEPKRFQTLGGRMPKGILLVGPPGNGKTLLARAVAGEAGVPFFSADASSFVEMFVGVGAARVRDLFEDAKKRAPCIIFIDELDAIGKKRGGLSNGGGDSEREQTLNQLLIAMDGFSANEGIILMAATNRPETLDSALTRSGRLDRQVVVPRPDLRGREKILKIHSRDKVIAPDVDFVIAARRTTGMSGADLESVMNEAALHAGKLNKPAIELADIEHACKKVQLGVERKSAVIPETTKKVVSVHECGHTLAGWFTVEADQIREVTIVPRGQALGLTWSMPDEDQVLLSKKQLLAKIQLLYGGRIAEQVVFGPEFITTGASNDLERLSKIAKGMVKTYGMCPELGPPQVFGDTESGFVFQESRKDYSDKTEALIDDQVNKLLKGCYDQVLQLLTEKRDLLDKLTAALLDKESLGQAEIEAILGPRNPILA